MIVPKSPSVDSTARFRQPQATPRSTIPPRPKPRSGEYKSCFLLLDNFAIHSKQQFNSMRFIQIDL